MSEIVRSGDLVLRELTSQDAKLLKKWLSDERVLEYYEGRDRPHDAKLVEEHFISRLGTDITQCVILYGSFAIGYLQFYPLKDEERDAYGYSKNERVFGMDQFIGEVTYWNQGIGTRIVERVAHFLLTEVGADVIVMDPHAWNERALRVYEKVGFKRVRLLPEHEHHEGKWRDCWLVEKRRLYSTEQT